MEHTRSTRILGMLNLPKYESTKGLPKDLREKAVEKYQDILSLQKKSSEENSIILATAEHNDHFLKRTSNEISPDSFDIDKASTSKLPSKLLVTDRTKKVNIISQFIILPKSSPPPITCSNDVISAKNPISNHDILQNISCKKMKLMKDENCMSEEEDRTSGSEYLPTDDSNSISSTSDYEIKNCFSIKKSKNRMTDKNMIKKPKRRINNVHPQKKKLKLNPVSVDVVDSTTHKELQLLEMSDTELITSTEEDCQSNDSNLILAAAKDDGKLVRNKSHACYYCQRIVQNAARHFELLHEKELDVAKLLAKPKYSKERRDGFANIIRVGDFYHNIEVLSTKRGHLILVRRPTENEAKCLTANDYGPCPHCLGFMLKKHLWHHIKTSCTAKSNIDADNSRHIIAESDALINDAFGADFSTDFVTNIITKLREDDVGIYCKEDGLIQRFGAMLFEKYGTTQCELTRQSMRQLARLTLKLRDLHNSKKTLSDFLVPQFFDLIIQATKSLCVTHQNSALRPEFELPSLALKIGHSLKKCANIKRGRCLRGGNLSGNESLLCFLNLMELEWCSRISSNALATLYSRKLNSTQLLPLTSDLIKLSQYLNKEMIRVRNLLSANPSFKNWSLLASLTLSKMILFNKRRSGEAARMTLQNYSSRPKWSDQTTEELKKSLSDFEIKLASQLTLVEVVGKRGRKVPVLLTEDVKLSIDKLNETRETFVNKENIFVFSRCNGSIASMRGHECLRKACVDAGLQHPENITSTKLRKYTATVCQVFNLSENDYDWLARHLGHDIRVHREFYRLHESAVELTKVSRLLIAVDKGQVSKFAGKALEEINLEDFSNAVEESSDDESPENENIGFKANISNSNGEGLPFIQEMVNSNVSTIPPLQVAPKEAKTAKPSNRRPWLSEEKEAVLKYFKNSIKRGVVPGKADCSKCIEENDVLSDRNRSWTDVKFCVKNQIDKIKKINLF